MSHHVASPFQTISCEGTISLYRKMRHCSSCVMVSGQKNDTRSGFGHASISSAGIVARLIVSETRSESPRHRREKILRPNDI